MPKIIIDQEACIGCGACVAVAPELFELNEDNKAEAKIVNELKEEELIRAKEGAETCPVQAIKVE
jgi:ferredoxin